MNVELACLAVAVLLLGAFYVSPYELGVDEEDDL